MRFLWRIINIKILCRKKGDEKMRNYQKFCVFMAFLTGIFIFYVSSLEFPPSIPGISYTSVLYHFSVFFILTSFLFLTCKFENKFFILVLLISLLYAGLDELHQYFVPNRVADFFDLAVDFSGSAVSLIFLGILRRIKKF